MRHIEEAWSKENGIIFCSTICPEIAIETTRDSSGKIHSKIVPKIILNMFELWENANNNAESNKHFGIIIALIDLTLVITSLILNNIGLICATSFFIWYSFDFFGFFRLSYQMKLRNGPKHSIAKFHSAEHMAVNAYNKLGRVPTLEEIKHYSRFHSKCGSRIIILKLLLKSSITILIAFSPLISTKIYFALLIIIQIIISIANKYGFLKIFQIFVTSNPTDSELELAIEGLKILEDFDNKLEHLEDSIVMIPKI